MANGRRSGRHAAKVPNLFTIDLNPAAHQRLAILFSVSAEGLKAPCKFPQTLVIDYYTTTDMTLGQYIEELVRSTRSACNVCQRYAKLRDCGEWVGGKDGSGETCTLPIFFRDRTRRTATQHRPLRAC